MKERKSHMWMNVSTVDDDFFRRSIETVFQINGTLSQLEQKQQQRRKFSTI